LPIEHDNDDATRAVAHLPWLEIEVTHRRSEGTEQFSIHMQALPSFAAFGDALDAANPFAFWAKAAQWAWLPWSAWLNPSLNPWLDATRALMPPGAVDTPPMVPEA